MSKVTIFSIPDPIIEQILLEAGPKSASTFSATCSLFRCLVLNSEVLWGTFSLKEYGSTFKEIEMDEVETDTSIGCSSYHLFIKLQAWVCIACGVYMLEDYQIYGGSLVGLACTKCWEDTIAMDKVFDL